MAKEFTVQQCDTTKWVCLAVGLFGCTLTDKESSGLYMGVALVLVVAAFYLFVRFNTGIPEAPPLPIERVSAYYMTVRELIAILGRLQDDNVAVLDSEGHPITNVLAVFDEDFSESIRLMGFPVNRNLYRLTKKTDALEAAEVLASPPSDKKEEI